MRFAETLREQARVLHLLAMSFEAHLFRDDLLMLVKRCEELADDVERETGEQRSEPMEA